MSLSNEDIEKLEDLYFNEKYGLYKMQYDSFHQFIDNDVYLLLKESENIFYEKVNDKKDKIYRYRFKYDNISIKPPTIDQIDEYMFPEDARKKHLTYSSKLVADVTQLQDIIDVNTEEKITKITGSVEKEVPIAKLPIMVRSRFCTTNIRKDVKNTECIYDPGCYFIVNGNEKIVISTERICENKILVFTKKDTSFPDGKMYVAQVNSKAKNVVGNVQILAVYLKKDKTIMVKSSQLGEIPLYILLRGLGLITDYDIAKYITFDMHDTEMLNILQLSSNMTKVQSPKNINEEIDIKNNEEALDYLVEKIKYSRKYSDTNLEIQKKQKRAHLEKIFKKDILPHMGDNILNKAIYICYMVNRLINTAIGRHKPDDRDSYVNKRIELPGELLSQLFKQYYKKMINDISRFFKNKNNDDINPINVISQIKPNTIEQGIKTGLLTGIWGSSKSKKGVAQALQRYTYLQTISYLRRIIAPAVDASTTKVTSIRHVHNVQYGYICGVETPEGGKIGLIKNLALSA